MLRNLFSLRVSASDPWENFKFSKIFHSISKWSRSNPWRIYVYAISKRDTIGARWQYRALKTLGELGRCTKEPLYAATRMRNQTLQPCHAAPVAVATSDSGGDRAMRRGGKEPGFRSRARSRSRRSAAGRRERRKVVRGRSGKPGRVREPPTKGRIGVHNKIA